MGKIARQRCKLKRHRLLCAFPGFTVITIAIILAAAVSSTSAQDSPHGSINIPCASCHSTDSWRMKKNAGFRHDATGFVLLGKHASVPCASCHAGLKFSTTSSDCYSCHTDVHRRELGTDCARCHSAESWRIPDMVEKHQGTRFPLLGRHATLACQSCHINAAQKQFAGTPTDCFSCHRNDYARTTNPNHTFAGFSTNCEQCHRVTSFRWGTNFTHEATAFPLRGAHRSVACSDCHKRPTFSAAPTQCVGCHQANFSSTTNPNHQGAGFSTECQTCHTTTTWAGARFDHNRTLFPLQGAHQVQQCRACHGDNVFAGKPTDCVSCHRQEYNATLNPNHARGNFPTQCQSCHSQMSWRPSTFNHAATAFPLTGAHVAVSCEQCHRSGQYANLPSTCVDCHRGNFTNATNPNHQTSGFGTNCRICHSTTSWHPASYNHSLTNFPLTGRHATMQCQDCHVSGNYQLQYTNCYPCHTAQYAQPQNPNHVAGNFNHDCSPCHTTTAWGPSTFNHGNTAFPLVGAHQTVTCNQCHQNNQYHNLPHTCWDCHATTYNTTTNPSHQQGQFSHDCLTCHTQSAWHPASFNHSSTNFPLTGRHATVQCQDCHVNGNYQLQYTNCYPCHTAQYAQPQNPNHVAGNFNHDCSPCHTTTAWRPSTFNHSNTSFPLTGAHQATSCNQCHVNNQYQGLPATCVGCHLTDYNTTTNPNHAARNFSQNCTECHTTAAWRPASFDHSTTAFPLTGRHVTTNCVACHVNNNYNLTYQDCYQCHAAQYAQPQNPNHVTLQFSHDCTPCHTTSAWRPSTFNHDVQYFRIYSGKHRGKWNTCLQCHSTPGQYLDFTCLNCHEHNRTDMDRKHREVQNYQYSSPACYSCHRNV